MKKVSVSLLIVMIIFMCTNSCSKPNKPQIYTISLHEKLISIASDYIKKNYPSHVHILEDEARVQQEEKVWVVYFKIPVTDERYIRVGGGRPAIHISKKTLEVVAAYRSQ